MTDRPDRFEAQLRGALSLRAAQADDSAAAVGRVLPSASRGRRTAWLAAAAAVVLVGAVSATVARQQPDDPSSTAPGTASSTASATPTGTPTASGTPGPDPAWRTESWHGVQVDVPVDWGWGGALVPDFLPGGARDQGRLLDCGASAYRSATGRSFLNGDRSLPYVGRPVMQTDACVLYRPSDLPVPAADHVWFGVPLEPGVQQRGELAQETVVVAGTTVTVTTRDPELRARIVASVRATTGPCPATATPSGVAVAHEGGGLTACAYVTPEDGGPADLVYATTVDQAGADRLADSWLSGPDPGVADCFLPGSREWVALAAESDTYLVRFGPGCPTIEHDGLDRVLTTAATRPWAVDGVRVSLSHFVGMLG